MNLAIFFDLFSKLDPDTAGLLIRFAQKASANPASQGGVNGFVKRAIERALAEEAQKAQKAIVVKRVDK